MECELSRTMAYQYNQELMGSWYNTQTSLQTCFFDTLNLCKILPSSQLLSRNLAETLQVLIYDNNFSGRVEIGRRRTSKKNNESGEGFVKSLPCQKLMCGRGMGA